MLCVLLFLAHAVYFSSFFFFFFNDTATTEIYTLSLHDALPILGVLVERRGLAEFAGVVADLRLHEEARSEHGAPLQRLVVGAVLDLAVAAAGREVAVLHGGAALRAVLSRGRVAEKGELDLLLGRYLPVDLAGVVVGGPLPVELAARRWEGQGGGGVEAGRRRLVEYRHSGARGRESRVRQGLGRHPVRRQDRVEGEEVEELVFDERPAHREREVLHVLVDAVGRPAVQLDELPRRLQAARARIPGHASLEVVGARLDDRVDDAAERLAVLGLEAAGLDLHLVEELAGDAGAKRAVVDVVGADAAEARVGDVDAVDQVGVLQSRGTADRVVAVSGAEPADHTRRHGVRVGEGAADRDGVREVFVLDVRARRGRGHVHQRRLAADRDRLGLARLEGEIEIRLLAQPDRHVIADDGGEPARRLGAHRVGGGPQERQDVAATRVGLGGAGPELGRRDDHGAGNAPPRGIDDLAGDGPGGQLLGQDGRDRGQEHTEPRRARKNAPFHPRSSRSCRRRHSTSSPRSGALGLIRRATCRPRESRIRNIRSESWNASRTRELSEGRYGIVIGRPGIPLTPGGPAQNTRAVRKSRASAGSIRSRLSHSSRAWSAWCAAIRAKASW